MKTRKYLPGITSLLVALMFALGSAQASWSADSNLPPIRGDFEETDIVLGAEETIPGAPPENNNPAVLPIGSGSVPVPPQRKFEPVCIPNLADVSIECVLVNASCSVGPDGTLMRILEAPAGQNPPQWVDTTRTICQYSDRPLEATADGGDEMPVVTIEFFRRLPIAPSGLTVEPVPHTLVGAETNVYATPNEQTFNEEIDGFDVTVRAIPTSYTWSYGDGSSLGPTSQPGGPLPADRLGEKTATSHRYTETGDVQISLTTTYRGEYSINGSAWIAISGEAQITSATVELSVWRSVVNNYADNCLDNPEGAGC
ncbi:hypothetical protein [Arthrobacter sp. CAU 1506]|uniref:hypothetical protein n=1 Tax=Arthrobacter sp. CAU 1506 TaxID=2560052 RepID=UPI001F0DD002|nr:hypothetical protein [Arthrobacter sp. CAU 1506]